MCSSSFTPGTFRTRCICPLTRIDSEEVKSASASHDVSSSSGSSGTFRTEMVSSSSASLAVRIGTRQCAAARSSCEGSSSISKVVLAGGNTSASAPSPPAPRAGKSPSSPSSCRPSRRDAAIGDPSSSTSTRSATTTERQSAARSARCHQLSLNAGASRIVSRRMTSQLRTFKCRPGVGLVAIGHTLSSIHTGLVPPPCTRTETKQRCRRDPNRTGAHILVRCGGLRRAAGRTPTTGVGAVAGCGGLIRAWTKGSADCSATTMRVSAPPSSV